MVALLAHLRSEVQSGTRRSLAWMCWVGLGDSNDVPSPCAAWCLLPSPSLSHHCCCRCAWSSLTPASSTAVPGWGTGLTLDSDRTGDCCVGLVGLDTVVPCQCLYLTPCSGKLLRFLCLSNKLNCMCKRQESPLPSWQNNCIISVKKTRKLVGIELPFLKITVSLGFFAHGGSFLPGYGILKWFKWRYTCPPRTEHMDVCKYGNKQTGFSVLISLLQGAEAEKHRVTSTALTKCMKWPKMMMMTMMYGDLFRLKLYKRIGIDAPHLKEGEGVKAMCLSIMIIQ